MSKKEKNVNKNFAAVLSMACVLLLVSVLCFIVFIFGYIENKKEQNDILRFIGAVGNGFILTFGTIIPSFVAVITSVLAFVSWKIYSSENRKRLFTYRIITGFVLLCLLLFGLGYSAMALEAFYIITVAPAIVFDTMVIIVSVILIKNTYFAKSLTYKEGE